MEDEMDANFDDEVVITPKLSVPQLLSIFLREHHKKIALFSSLIAIILLAIVLIILGIWIFSGSDEETNTSWSYGVVVDMGSSGSRIHVFQWSINDPVQPAPHGGPDYWYTDEKPGVSSYAGDPSAAAASLDPLLNFAVECLQSVSADLSTVPIFGYATAGLRLLPSDQSEAILEAIRQEIKSYGFLFEDDWVAMITGTQEATYDWLSIQEIIYIESYYNASYVFYQFPSISKTTTVGVIDLGGGSVEMTFYPPDDALGTTVNEGEFVALNFNTKYYDIYGHSYLGYGHNSARTLLQGTLSNNQDPSIEVTDPCTNSGYSYNATVGQYTYTFVGDYDQSACDAAIQKLFDKNIECSYSHCSFLGIYQPLVDGSNFVALDDMALVVLFMNVSENPKIEDIYTAATHYCSTSFTELMIEYPEVSSNDLGKYCFEANYIYQMLSYGYGFAESSQQILFAQSLYGIELSWALGVMTSEQAEQNF